MDYLERGLFDMKNAFRKITLALMGIVLVLALYSCNGGGDDPVVQPGGDQNVCEHTEIRGVMENEHPATCTEGGAYDTVVYCAGCNMEMGRDKVFTEPLGHDEISHLGKAPGCEEDGYEDYITCSRCEYTTYTAIDAVGHDKIYHNARNETCTEVGWHDYETCANCDYTTYDELPALNHDKVTELAQEPSCTNPGWYEYEYCSRCDYTTYEEIPPLNHKTVNHLAQEPTCTDYGWYAYQSCERCDWDTKYENLIDPLDHDKVYHEAKSETCTEDGWYAYETCTRCSYSTRDENIIEKRHLMETDWGKKETCTEIGWDIYHYCTRCDYKESYNEIPALKHDIVTMPAKAPTCTEGGWCEFQYCSRGDWSEELESQLAPLDHCIIEHAAKEPTCTEGGWYAYQTCSRCDAINTKVERDALGHLPNDQSKAPTCTEGGYTKITCDRCIEYNVYEERAALGHDDVPMVRIEPTCTTVGYETIAYCRRCYVIEHTPQVAPEPVLLNTIAHNFVNGECTACHNREGSAGLAIELASDGKSYELVGLRTCTDKVIIIPATYNDLPVSRIKQSALAYSDIVSVYIPSTIDPTIISIDNSVFIDCFNLVEIINNSEIDTEDFSFFVADQLLGDHNGKSNTVLLGDYYFYVENGEAILVSYIGGSTEITLPESFNGNTYKIHTNAFRESGIESIVIPTSVTQIGDWAFMTTNRTECVTVSYLGTKAEWNEINRSADTNQWIKELVYHYGRACDSTEVAEKAPTCTEWGYSAYTTECTMCGKRGTDKVEYEPTGHFYMFVECKFCGEEIVYSEGLEYELSADGKYYIVTGMGECTDDYVIIPSHYNEKPVQEIGESAFEGVEVIGVHVPVTVKIIGDSAFMNCYMLKYVSLGYEVETIDRYAFGFCDALVAIKLGGYLEYINSSAFYYCEALTDVYYTESEEDWAKIQISEYDNDCLTDAEIHYDFSDSDI